MDWLIISWIIAGVVIAEIVFYFWQRYNQRHWIEWSVLGGSVIDPHDWGWTKILSFLLTGVFLTIQIGIVHGVSMDNNNWIHLLYEFLIVGGIYGFIRFNKFIVKRIEKKEERRLKDDG